MDGKTMLVASSCENLAACTAVWIQDLSFPCKFTSYSIRYSAFMSNKVLIEYATEVVNSPPYCKLLRFKDWAGISEHSLPKLIFY